MTHQKMFLFSFILLFGLLVGTTAQTIPVIPTASITGQIKIKDNPAPGVVVTLVGTDRNQTQGAMTKVNTDADGRYKFSQVAAGNYRVVVLAPGYVVFAATDVVRLGQQIAVKDGENVERLDFTMARGGVITGKVTNKENRPVIGEPITLLSVDESGKQTNFNSPDSGMLRTDDRGEYRVYGLPTGKYLVSAGRGDNRGGGPPVLALQNRTYLRTYHPDVTDATQAAPITVETGQEVTAIDIRMASVETYAASGRVVDAESGNPVNAVLIAHRTEVRNRRGGGGMGGGPQGAGTTDGMSGTEGEFKIEGLAAGSYAAYVVQDQTTAEFYSEPASFEITSADVTGLEIKLQRGASIAGTIVLDGTTNPDLLNTMQISANVRGSSAVAPSPVLPNSTFRIAGLSPGRVNLNVTDMNNPGPFSGLTVLRLERNGADVQGGFEVTKGEQVTGVRVFVAKGNSTIRGVVRVDGGALTPDMRLMVFARRTDGGSTGGMGGGMPTQVDSSGKFQIDNLVGGTYTVSVQSMFGGFGGGGIGGAANRPGGNGQQQARPSAAAQQTVVLSSGAAQDVVLTLDAAAMQAIQNSQGNINQPGNRGGNNPGGNQPGTPGGGQNQGPRRRP